MTHFNLNRMLQGCSAFIQTMAGNRAARNGAKRVNNHVLPLTCPLLASSLRLTCPLQLRRIALILCVLVLSIGQAWGATVEFVAGTSSGMFSQTTTLTSSPVTLTTNATGGNASSRQIWKDGGTNKNETAIQLSSSAGETPSGKYIEVTVASGYKITGLTVRGAINSTSSGTYTAFCWAGAYSEEAGKVTGTGSLAFPGYNGTSDGANVSMTGIVDGTRTIRIYKQVKYNSSTNTIGNVTGASNTPSTAPGNVNIAKITVTYVTNSGSCTVTYNNNGGSGSIDDGTGTSVTLSDGTGFTAPSGYSFSGWNTANDGSGTSYASGVSVTEDLDLYAKWTQTVTLNANTENHGSGANGSATATWNATALSEIAHTTPAGGYKRTGYYTAQTSGTKVLNADGSYANTTVSDYITSNKWIKTGSTTLYAQYEEEVPGLTHGTYSMTSAPATGSSNIIKKHNNIFYGRNGSSVTTNSGLNAKALFVAFKLAETSTVQFKLNNTNSSNDRTDAWDIKSLSTADIKGISDQCETAGTATTYFSNGNSALTSISGTITKSTEDYTTISATLSAGCYGFYQTSHSGDGNFLTAVIIAAPSSCTAPSSVGISGEWRYFPGQTISLTATPTGHTGTPTYQWQKEISADNWQNISNGTEAGVTISGATTNNLQITPCGTGNTGKYRCSVSTGATCSTTSDPFSVKIFTLNGAYDDGEFTSNNITFTSGTTGTATVHLAAGRVYKFKVTDNFGMWFGNSGRILEPAVNWTFPSNNSTNCVLFTGPEGDYTFTVDIDHVTYGTPEVVVSVAYPEVTHPSAGYAYFKDQGWTHVGLHMWYEGGGEYSAWASDPWVTKTTTICGATYYYTPLIPSWYNRVVFHEVTSGTAQTGNITISGLATYSGQYNDKNDNEFHEFTTYTITYAANGGGGSMSATSGICPDADQAITSNSFTKPSGCASFAHWIADVAVTANGAAVAAGNPIADGATLSGISGDIALTAVWKLAAPTITDNGDNTFSISGSITGASYYYTTNGGTPTTSSSAYSSAVDFSAGEDDITAQAIAHKDGYVDSDVASQACTYHAPAGGCPTAASGEVVYKFVTKSSGLGTSAICANKDQDYPLTTGSGNPLETLMSGTLTARASSAATTQLKYNTSSINLNGGSNGWLIIGLDCPIQSGDVIRYVNSNSGSVAIRTAKSSDANQIVLAGNSTTEVQTVVISSAQATAFNELTTVYMVRKSGTSDISYFEIIRPYVITLDANTNGGKVNGENTEVHYMLSGESLVLPHATKSGGYRFKGWFTTSDGATQASTNYSPTGSTTLYAQFEDCPGSGTVYKWEVASGLTNESVTSNGVEFEFNVTNDLSTLIGGTLITDGSKASYVKIADNSMISIEDNGAYLKVDLDCALEAGDKFVATIGSHTAYVTAGSGDRSSAAKRAELPTGTKQETAVPAALEGASTLYIWRGDGNCKISYFEITRTSTTYTVSYDANGGSGTAPTDGTAYARNAEVTVKDNTGSLSKSNYAALAYWNTKDDGTGTDYAISTGTFEITADVTLYAKWTQAVTLDANTANHGSVDGSATAVWNAKALTGITHATPASGYKLLGYYTTASGDGVKVLNSDGTFAGTNVTDYITSGKWSRTGAAPTLYARYESSGSLIWNLGVNTEATSLTTSSKTSEFAQIAGSNMTDAALTGISYSQSKQSELTGVIETPTSYDGAKYVSVTFQVAAGYKFTPSSVNVKVQPKDNAKTVKIELSDAFSHSQNYTSDSQSAGSIHTVTMTGNGTFYTGTVTLKIYCYGASGGYRLGTPISIEGEVEATCTMPSFDGLNYEETSYNLDDDASAITVTNPANVTTYAWKQNTTNDRSGTTPASGTNDEASYTPPTDAAGTMYYWCELTNKCGTVKTPAVGITVSATKSDATISWTGTSASANYGGGGYTVKATVNETGWNGNAADLTLSAPAGIRIYDIVSGTADSKKYVQASFDVTTAFDRETNSTTIPFVVTADATATYNAISDEEDVTFDACTGGGGSSEEYMPVDAAHIDNTTWKGGWVYSGIGMMRYNHGGSAVDDGNVKSLTHDMGAGNVITKYYKSSANHFGFYTEKAINGVRLYVYTSNDKSTVSGVYIANSAFATGNPSTGAVTYEATYNNDDDGLLGATNDGCTWVEIMFDSEVAAGKYGQINLSKNVNIAGIAFISSSGSGAKLNTHLQWSGGLKNNETVNKKTTDAYFTYSASMITENTNSLGAITYSSSNPSVATVDATGKVAMVAAGTTTIKATLAASGCYKKAEISYTLKVTEEACAIAAGTLALTSGAESKCSSDNVTLTLTGFESEATLQWKDGDTNINDGGNYKIVTDGTTSTLTTDQPGTYSVIVTKGCVVRSNRITITNKSTSVHVTRLVKEWYIKNGRLTPDIALWELGDDCSFVGVTASSGWDDNTGLTAASSFYEKDGIVYLKGTEPNANAGAVQDYTLTLTVNDGCGNQILDAEGKIITIHHQQNTDKHVLAFVVGNTEKDNKKNYVAIGKGFTESIPASQTTQVSLYNAIAAQFAVQPTNIYSTDDEQKIKEYYSQFDIICITDYPNTQTKGANSKSYVDAIGALIDIRPILTMEAFVSALPNWKLKGISGNPKSPTTRQYTMLLQCKDHEIFAGTELTQVGTGDEAMFRISMVDNAKEDYATLDATYGATLPHKEKESKPGAGDGEYNYGGKPALQGFTYTQEMSNNDLLPLGLIDDGSGNDLQVGIERQAVMEARLMVLGINSYAMERLDKDGETVVINALNYLLKKNAEDIADCSISFVGGAEGDAKNWHNVANWTGNTLPTKSQKVRILAECELNASAHVAGVTIVNGGKYNHGTDDAKGKLTIMPNGALVVTGKVQEAKAPAYNKPYATSPEHLIINTSSMSQAALIFNNDDASTQATVNYYSRGRKSDDVYQFQYFAVPMEYVDVNPAFAGSGIYTYAWHENGGWERRGYYTELYAFEGLGITTRFADPRTYTMKGTLASTAEREVTLTHESSAAYGNNIIGNSWMAPINIASLKDAIGDDDAVQKTVYIYSTGNDKAGGRDGATSSETATAGQWLAIPIEAAAWDAWSGLKVIPAMQAFMIRVNTETSLTLNYNDMVRSTAIENMNVPLHAPKRNTGAQGITLTRMRVEDSNTHTDMYLFEGERFNEEFDNGWEAVYMPGNGSSAQFYAMNGEDKMAVLATDELEGTPVCFAPGKESNYTISFLGGDGTYYLNDLKEQTSTLIEQGNTYSFIYEAGDMPQRFLISTTPFGIPSVTTGVGTVEAQEKVQKVIYQDKIYIIRGGKIYDVVGKMVK